MPQVACHISFCGSLDYHLKQVMQSQLSYINGFEDVKMKKQNRDSTWKCHSSYSRCGRFTQKSSARRRFEIVKIGFGQM